MDERLLILGEIEEEVRQKLGAYESQLRQIDIEDIIDAVFGELGRCLDIRDRDSASRKMRIACSLLFYYAFGKENKPEKKELEAFKYHYESSLSKIQKFKNELWKTEDFPYDKELETLHLILDKALESPYKFIQAPKHIPTYQFSKNYIKDKLQMSFYKRDKGGCVRAISRTIALIDQKLNR